MRPGARLALLAAWGALATGLTELALRATQKVVLHRFIYQGQQIVWMTPLAELLLFGAVALGIGLVAYRWPAAAGVRGAATVLAGLAGISVLLMQPWLHWWANVILALGFAVTAGRLAAAHEARVLRVMRLTLPGFVVLVAGMGTLVHARAVRAEARALAALPAAPPGAPNILFIIWDTVRAASVSLLGYDQPTTPRLTALAARGVTFERAMAPASYTLPTHASFFTGRDPHQLTASWLVPLDDRTPTLAEALAERGYRTAGFSANHIFGTWEQGLQRGFSRFEDYPVSWAELLRSASLPRTLLAQDGVRRALGLYDAPERRHAPEIQASFLRWLDAGTADRPFFAFLNLYDAHEPYLPRAPFDTLFGWPAGGGAALRRTVRSEALATKFQLDAVATLRQQHLYEGAIAELDHDLGDLLDALAARGVLDRTIVIVASDHGEAFGEHRTWSHGNDLYQNVVHVPLVIVYPPAVPEGVRVPGVVTLRDIPATVGELVHADGSWPLAGRSLTRFWSAAPPVDTVLTEIDRLPKGGESWYAVTRGDVRSIIAWPHQLILTGDSTELYDLAADPGQQHDLARAPDRRETLDALLAALRARRADAVPSKR